MNPSDHDPSLENALRARREIAVDGFAERALGRIRRDRSQRRVIRWVALASPLAACLALLLSPLGGNRSLDAEMERLFAVTSEFEVGVPPIDDSEALAIFAVSDR
jgi:hypothetical protein